MNSHGGSASAIRLRFTELVVAGGTWPHFNVAGSYDRTATLTNNVFDRVNFSLGNGSDPTLTA
jgi:hypothetical protein